MLVAAASIFGLQQVVEVCRAAEGTTVRTMDVHCRASAVRADGSLFTIVAEERAGASGLDRQRLLLCASKDGGRTWATVAAWSVGLLGEASLVADPAPERPVVHVVFTSRDNEAGELGLAHRVFGVEESTWLGEATVVHVPADGDGQFQVADVEVGSDGALFVAALGFTARDRGLGRRPAVLFRREPKTGAWADPVRLNGASEGDLAVLALRGPELLSGYRARAPVSALMLRRMALATGELAAERAITDLGDPILPTDGAIPEERLAALARRPLHAPRAFSMLHDADGEVRVLQVVTSVFGSELRLTTDPEGRPSHERVDTDLPAPMRGEDFQHFGLARGPGAELYAIWSRLRDDHATLWWRRLGDDRASEPRLIATGGPGAFTRVNTVRSAHADCTWFAVASGSWTDAPGGKVVAVGVIPARVTRAVDPPTVRRK